MSNRATRRAAEREDHPISEAKLNANRANAEHSTGPASPEGKAKSSMNAVKTGLTGRTVLLPTDDAIAYQQHIHRHFARYTPDSEEENELVQSIADTNWRLLRIAPLEASIWVLGRLKLADLFPEIEDPTNREALIQGEIFSTYRKDLSNIALQERRLRNHLKADIAELKALKQERIDNVEKRRIAQIRAMDRAKIVLNNAETQKIPSDFGDFGFEFSEEECRAYHARNSVHQRLCNGQLNVDRFLTNYRKEQQTA
jgi:hypothetical protein